MALPSVRNSPFLDLSLLLQSIGRNRGTLFKGGKCDHLYLCNYVLAIRKYPDLTLSILHAENTLFRSYNVVRKNKIWYEELVYLV